MQTKSQIQQLLATRGLLPNRRLGQNFLIDLNLMNVLLNAADIQKSDTVLEVGPGTGSLTVELAGRAGRVIAVEFDSGLAQIAAEQLASVENLRLINEDILKDKNNLNPKVINHLRESAKTLGGRLMLVSNLPYKVASPVMMNLTIKTPSVDAMCVTIQKEVAQRMTASAGDKHYGSLSIFLAATGSVETLRNLKPSVFWPQPQINSAMIGYRRDEQKSENIKNMELFHDLVSALMNHRRKMVRSIHRFAPPSLQNIDNWPRLLESACIDPESRPEKIPPEQFVQLANLCQKQLA